MASLLQSGLETLHSAPLYPLPSRGELVLVPWSMLLLHSSHAEPEAGCSLVWVRPRWTVLGGGEGPTWQDVSPSEDT